MTKEDYKVEITSINSKLLAKMFLAGAKNLDSKKDWINELNVFPVPDGDTGTNMSMTIMSAAKEVKVAKAEKPSMVKRLRNQNQHEQVFNFLLEEFTDY